MPRLRALPPRLGKAPSRWPSQPKRTDPELGTAAHKGWARAVKERAGYRCEDPDHDARQPRGGPGVAVYLRSAKAPMFGTSLSRSQVAGIEGILDAFAVTGDGRDKTLAYGLATARREVGAGMVPVREGFKKTDAEARAYVLRHYPTKYGKPAGPWGHVYYGRGIVQLTWLDNYEREGIAADPDKALEPKFAAELMFKGLLDGRWNGLGKGLAHYLPTDGPDDLKNARRTVNITDHWEEIAGFYRQFMGAITAART